MKRFVFVILAIIMVMAMALPCAATEEVTEIVTEEVTEVAIDIGVVNEIIKEMTKRGEEVPTDAFGHPRLDKVNVGQYFAKRFGELLGAEKTQVFKSGYFARSAAPCKKDLELIEKSLHSGFGFLELLQG